MPSMILTPDNLRALKRELRGYYDEVKSAHLSEAIAAAFGRRTHAALLADLARADPSDPEIILFDEHAFVKRANEIGVEIDREDIEWGIIPGQAYGAAKLINTEPPSSYNIKYSPLRGRAWRNMIVSAVNAAIQRKHFSLRPGDNRWPHDNKYGDHVFEFTFGSDIPAICYIHDAGYDEISIHVALWPTKDSKSWVRAANAGFLAGEAFAMGWLERREGAWLQRYEESLSCRQKYLRIVAEVEVAPIGYGDRGEVIL